MKLINFTQLLKDCAAKILGELYHIGSSIVAALPGALLGFCSAIVKRLKIWWDGRKVLLEKGAPTEIAKGITKLLDRNIYLSQAKVCEEAAATALACIAPMSNLIVKGFAKVVETIYDIIRRKAEVEALNNMRREFDKY